MDRAVDAHQRSGTFVERSQGWLLIPCGLALLLVAWHVVRSGTWLDEYWQLWISGAPLAELPDRLVTDTHPPWFNLFARLILFATGDAVVPARIVNLLAGTAVLGCGLWRIRGLDAGLRWRIGLLILASGGAVGMTDLAASFRSYPWLLIFAGLQSALLAAIALKRPIPPVLAGFVTTAGIAIHYGHAAGAIAIAMVSAAVAWRSDRRAFRAIFAGLVAGVLLDVITGLIQLPHWRTTFDVNWIAQSGAGGVTSTVAAVAIAFVTGNLVAAALLAAGLVSRRTKTALVVLAPIPLAIVGWAILDALNPILTPRYLASVTAMLATAAAVGWWELALARPANVVLALLAAVQPLASSIVRPPLDGWEEGARIVRRAVANCSESRVYAVSAWRFRDHPDSRSAQFENPVAAFAYAKVGDRFGLKPQFVTGPTSVDFGRCPAIVWIEAAHGVAAFPPDVILRHAQLKLPRPARVQVVPTPNGAVLLLFAADRLQRRQ